jgi:hypothetical protein
MVSRADATDTSARLDRARAALAEADDKLNALTARRAEKLIGGTAVRDLHRVDADIADTERVCATERDRVALLEKELAKEEAEARAKKHQARIESTEAKIAERVEEVATLQRMIADAQAQLRKVVEISGEIDSKWVFEPHDRLALILPAEHIITATRNEIFRINTPSPTGTRGFTTAANLPGGKPPSLQVMGNPGAVPEMVTRFKEAQAAALQILRTGKSTASTDFRPIADDGVPAYALKDELKPPLSPNQTKLAELLRAQAAFANDISPEGERAYQEIVAAIAELQGEIDEAAKEAAA